MAGRSMGSSPTRQLIRMRVEAGPTPSMSGGDWPLRPTNGRRTPQGVLKGSLKKPQRYQQGWWLSMRYADTNEHQDPHPQVAFCLSGA